MKIKIIVTALLFFISIGVFLYIEDARKIQALDLYPIKIGNNFGYISKDNDIIIKPQYKKALHFYNGVALVQKCNEEDCYVEYINKLGKRMNKEKIYAGLDFNKSLEVALVKDKYGYIDKTGKFIIKPQFSLATNFEEGIAAVAIYDFDRKCNLWGYINLSGKLIIPYQFFEASPFVQGFAIVKTFTGYNVINKNGKLLCKQNFSSDMPPFINNNKVFKYETFSDWALGTSTDVIEMDCNCNVIQRYKYTSNNDLESPNSKDEPYKYLDIHKDIKNDNRTRYISNFENDFAVIMWVENYKQKVGYINTKKEIGYFNQENKFIKTFQY